MNLKVMRVLHTLITFKFALLQCTAEQLHAFFIDGNNSDRTNGKILFQYILERKQFHKGNKARIGSPALKRALEVFRLDLAM